MPEHIALEKLEAGLIEIVDRLRESQEGYRELGHRLENETTKQLFMKEMQKRAEYAAELENELHRLGMHDVKVNASLRAKARLLWGEIQAGAAGGQKSLLTTAERQDDATVRTYDEILKEELPLPLREILTRQRERIQRVHDEVKALHDKS
jgi:uncharacterized protein (TIGR02284 family)